MKTIIIYGSQYGTTKRYAETFSEMTKAPVLNYKDLRDLTEYDLVIHFGGLYAGGVKGLKNTIKSISENTKLIIVTVGLADVNNPENTDNIKKSISRQVPERRLNNTPIFHLRGGIDYKKLSFRHRTMMTLLYTKAKNLPEDMKTAEVKALIETFNSTVDFVDFSSLNQIMDEIQ